MDKVISKSGKVVVVDDQYEEVRLLLASLNKAGVSTMFFSPNISPRDYF